MKDPPALSAQLEDYLRTYTARPDERLGQLERSLEMIRVSIAGYNDDVVQSDLRIGQIIDSLKEHDLFEDAVIIVTSDHGEGLWTREDSWNGMLRRQQRAKGQPISLYNLMKKGHGIHLHSEQIHVPLILKAPQVQHATVNSAVEGVDLFPTLLDLCDLPRPATLQGRSLLDAIRDDASWEESRPFAFSATRFGSTVVTQDGWHLLLPNQLGECQESMIPELYHLPSDPWERNNLASAQPALMSEFTGYASARMEMGLASDKGLELSFTPTNQDALLALGYIDNGIVDAAISALSTRTVESMLEYYLGSACILRLEIAKELAKRELNKEQLELVRSFLPEESSQVIYDVLRSID
jgi:arylsulfatase A-like enzyme